MDKSTKVEKAKIWSTDFEVVTKASKARLRAQSEQQRDLWVQRLKFAINPSSRRASTSGAAFDMSQMPDAKVVSERFEAFLQDKSFKPEVCERMRQLPQSHKWQLVCQDETVQRGKAAAVADGKASSKDATHDPKYWCEALTGERGVTEEQLLKLRVILRSEGRRWLVAFVQEGALGHLMGMVSNPPALLAPMEAAALVAAEETQVEKQVQLALRKLHRTATLIRMEATQTLRAFMNTNYGMKVVIGSPAAIEQVVAGLRLPSRGEKGSKVKSPLPPSLWLLNMPLT